VPKTERIEIDPLKPDSAAIRRAVEILQNGGLVAIPTETVYGLASHALIPKAVERIFEAKGRPALNPIIVHVLDRVAARPLVLDWPIEADRLADAYWPGPVTLILPRDPNFVPDRVTAGGSTIALRAPSHPVAQALLSASTFPIAAPSANRSEAISPTTADHVLATLDGRIDLVLDSGPTDQGIESTVVNLTTRPPRILRPGPISRQQLESILGPLSDAPDHLSSTEPSLSPGMLPRHYAPAADVKLTENPLAAIATFRSEGRRVCWIGLEHETPIPGVPFITMPTSAQAYRHRLYAALHEADRTSADIIVITRPPTGPEWEAIHDRLRRAASPRL
jgi:L-threonylcarbamoyladenylate synthase